MVCFNILYYVSYILVPYRCSSCSAVFDERRLLEAHYDLTHGDGLAKFCFRCGKLFSTLQSYNRHCQFVHEQPKPVPKHSCKYCNQSFATVQALKIHSTRKHTGCLYFLSREIVFE
ncbi:unnamed protein product [Hymenolepis diminuta]|uniref:C2H2-type domain-containing protein n=1 Tax=Hymenolepis diminuta TaxID=6216 RepID=A0A0R3SC43_HYMDI|nr:unnamed protein product [Hymenolepis diminuta]